MCLMMASAASRSLKNWLNYIVDSDIMDDIKSNGLQRLSPGEAGDGLLKYQLLIQTMSILEPYPKQRDVRLSTCPSSLSPRSRDVRAVGTGRGRSEMTGA